MARREVVEVVCDRCNRTETQAPGSLPKTDGPEATFRFHGAVVDYNDLCRRCRDTLANYFSKITKVKEEDESKPSVAAVKDSKEGSTAATAVKKGIFGGKGKVAS